MTRTRTLLAGLGVAVLLAACGGGSESTAQPDDGLTPMQRDDRAASASVAGLFAFASALIATMTSEAAEPRPIDGITPPVTEAAEPTAI